MSTQEKLLEGALSRIYEAQAIIAVVGFTVTHEQSLESEETRTRISLVLAGAEQLLENVGSDVGRVSGVYS